MLIDANILFCEIMKFRCLRKNPSHKNIHKIKGAIHENKKSNDAESRPDHADL